MKALAAMNALTLAARIQGWRRPDEGDIDIGIGIDMDVNSDVAVP